MNIPGWKAEDQLNLDGREKIFLQEQESWEQKISRVSELCSADTGGRLKTRGRRPWTTQATQTVMKEVSLMHVHQGEKSRVEKGTESSGEPPVPEDEEIRRTRRRKRRFGEMEWRQLRGRGWTAWLARRGRQTGEQVGQRNPNPGGGFEVDGM